MNDWRMNERISESEVFLVTLNVVSYFNFHIQNKLINTIIVLPVYMEVKNR